jgi:uncharacterized protein YllA (UPF0747 family)
MNEHAHICHFVERPEQTLQNHWRCDRQMRQRAREQQCNTRLSSKNHVQKKQQANHQRMETHFGDSLHTSKKQPIVSIFAVASLGFLFHFDHCEIGKENLGKTLHMTITHATKPSAACQIGRRCVHELMNTTYITMPPLPIKSSISAAVDECADSNEQHSLTNLTNDKCRRSSSSSNVPRGLS